MFLCFKANTQLQTTLSVAAFKDKPGGNVLLGVSTTNGKIMVLKIISE